MSDGRMALAYRLLDEQIVDVDGRRCGRVDDVELRGDPPRVTALLVGNGRYPRRVPHRLAGWARRRVGPEVLGKNVMRIPWSEVDEVTTAVHLRGKADDLGLGEGDHPSQWIASRLPWN
jgi:sporulation protein YlmC with PRC-barrel domain